MTIRFNENLKRLRKEKDLTQETLADFLGVSFQAVSKWERNESYPDITMLPAIASFFGVSLDTLLGTDVSEKEKRIKEYCDEYSRLWSEHKIDEVKTVMKQAISEFPGNFELMSRYFNALLYASREDEYYLSIKAEAYRVYDIIQNHCTVDSIRMWSKKLMCRYLRNLSFIKGSGVTIEDAEKILVEMPAMQNTRDYESMFMYPYDDEKRAAACAVGTAEMLRLLGEIIERKYSSPLDFDEEVLKGYVGLVEAVMPDGDYGKCYHLMVYDNGYIGVKRYIDGDYDMALEYFRRMCVLAAKYDELPDITTHTSDILEGLEFDKRRTLLGKKSMKECVKRNLTKNYPLSEDFKNSDEFLKILSLLG